jgi:hypothetical protein
MLRSRLWSSARGQAEDGITRITQYQITFYLMELNYLIPLIIEYLTIKHSLVSLGKIVL